MRFAALLLLLVPTMGIAFEPLNTDDAGTVANGTNQIEQYFFTTASHGSGPAATVDIITPGEEYFGGAGAKAFPFTYTRGGLLKTWSYPSAPPTSHSHKAITPQSPIELLH